MKLVVTKTNLKNSLKLVNGATKEDLNLPILKNILIEAEEDEIKIKATNLEFAITSILNGKIIEKGKTTIPANILLEIINNLQLERLNINSVDSKIEINTDNYNAVLNTQSPEEFPIIPSIKNNTNFIKIKSIILKEALEQVITSAQINEIRPELNSVLLIYNENLKLVTTDNFRLSEKTIPSTHFETNFKDNFKILIPLKTALEINKILNNEDILSIFIDENQILFKTENFEFISRLISGSFPDYENIIPNKFKTEIIINKEDLINGVKLVSILSGKTFNINIKTNNKTLELSSFNQLIGENKNIIQAKINGEEKEITFNWKYLLDGIKNIKTNDVFIGISDDNRPALIKSPTDEYFIYILMPILNI